MNSSFSRLLPCIFTIHSFIHSFIHCFVVFLSFNSLSLSFCSGISFFRSSHSFCPSPLSIALTRKYKRQERAEERREKKDIKEMKKKRIALVSSLTLVISLCLLFIFSGTTPRMEQALAVCSLLLMSSLFSSSVGSLAVCLLPGSLLFSRRVHLQEMEREEEEEKQNHD